MVRGIDNVGVCTSDLVQSVAFYQKLGFSEAYRNDRGVMMSTEGVNLFLFLTRKSNPPPVGRELGLFSNAPGIDHISFAVTDLDAFYRRQFERVVEFAIGEQSGIRGHHATAKLEHQAAIKIEPKNIRFRFTLRVRHRRLARSRIRC